MRDPKLLPLLLLHSCDEEPVEGITRFQKLVFLAQRETEYLNEYQFRSDSYGPFSVDLYDDIDELETNGYIECTIVQTPSGNEKQTYQLTEKGKEFIERVIEIDQTDYSHIEEDLCRVKREYNNMPLLKLLKRIYKKYPKMAENSELQLVY